MYSEYPPFSDSPVTSMFSQRYSLPSLQYWQSRHEPIKGVIPTLSPILNFVTSLPIFSILPTTSCPGTVGRVGGRPISFQSPSMECNCEWHTPHASILIKISFSFSILCISISLSFSGFDSTGPSSSRTMARIFSGTLCLFSLFLRLLRIIRNKIHLVLF